MNDAAITAWTDQAGAMIRDLTPKQRVMLIGALAMSLRDANRAVPPTLRHMIDVTCDGLGQQVEVFTSVISSCAEQEGEFQGYGFGEDSPDPDPDVEAGAAVIKFILDGIARANKR